MHFGKAVGGHVLGLQITVLVDSSHTQAWHLYSNVSLNWKKNNVGLNV